MTMEKLWAPWRVRYILNVVDKKGGCVFCRILKEKNDRKNFSCSCNTRWNDYVHFMGVRENSS